jgi:hypothetical protein
MDLDRFECGKAFQSLVRAAGDRKVLEVRRAGALSPVFWRNPRLRDPRPARTSFFLTEEQSRVARSFAFALRRGQSQTFGLRGNVIWSTRNHGEEPALSPGCAHAACSRCRSRSKTSCPQLLASRLKNMRAGPQRETAPG